MTALARESAAGAPREFPFSAEQFAVISERIYRFSGIRLTQAKREMVYARLARRLRSLGLGSFDDYVRFLELEPAEWEHCTNALTTNVTSFYREEHHFGILAAHARATDLDTQVLASAREAVYPLQAVLRLPEARQKRFFLRGTGRHEGRARVRPEIAAHVEFMRINLMDPSWPVERGLDAIFCRNVMIYFDKPTQRTLVERYAGLLKPEGLFFAGHAESLLDQGRHFRLRGQTVYELAGAGRSDSPALSHALDSAGARRRGRTP